MQLQRGWFGVLPGSQGRAAGRRPVSNAVLYWERAAARGLSLGNQFVHKASLICAALGALICIALRHPQLARPPPALHPEQGKAEVVQRVLEVQSLPGALPAQLVRPAAGKLTWVLDQAAASQLHSAEEWASGKAFPRSEKPAAA